MTNSSQQQDSSIDLTTESLITLSGTGTDTFTIELPSDLYTSTSYINTNMNTVSITSGGSGYTTVSDNSFTFNWTSSEEFVDSFPDWDRIKKMCDKYPSLEIALKNFETIYSLVKDDYDNPVPKK